MLGPVRKIECPNVREYTHTLILERSDCLAKQAPVNLRAQNFKVDLSQNMGIGVSQVKPSDCIVCVYSQQFLFSLFRYHSW